MQGGSHAIRESPDEFAGFPTIQTCIDGRSDMHEVLAGRARVRREASGRCVK